MKEKERVHLKKRLICGVTAFLLMAALPFLSAREGGMLADAVPSADESAVQTEPTADSSTNISVSAQESNINNAAEVGGDVRQDNIDGRTFRILDTSSGKVVTVSDRDFCYGALAYEMPPSYEKEALKAQCVACYTHFSYWRQQQREHPDEALQGADFKADLSCNQYYFSDEVLREKWGNLYEQSSQRLRQAVEECLGEVLRDREGALADVGYYALSAGVTENAKDIFGFESAYLQSVASPFDRSAPSYCTVVRVACDDMVKALDGQDKASVHQISQIQRTQAGSVLSLTIGEQTYTGTELRERLGLRSAHFTIEDKGDYFVFTVLGYGHGVGMSQYGANEMARQGADYREILAHYYQGAVISQ